MDVKDAQDSPIVVLGAGGQIGQELVRLLERAGRAVKGLTREEVNLSHPETVLRVLTELKPSAVINAAGYTAVELAEAEPALAVLVNAQAPGMMARWCAAHAVPFVHFSTDYVFSGNGDAPWSEEDVAEPLNAYGKSKLAGERTVQQAGGKYLIFRTSWVYAPEGKNFLNTMLRLGAEREELKVVVDQIGAPTLAAHLALATIDALSKATQMSPFPSGIYHACASGETSWYEFAQAIFKSARARGMELKVRSVLPISTSEYPTPARRPLNSRMNQQKLKETFGIALPDWKVGLDECLEHCQ